MFDVSIIVPCYNEEDHITQLLSAINNQTYPKEKIEVIIADGLSEDNTLQRINDFQDENPELHILIINNPKRIIPVALNKAIDSSKGEIVIRMDGHSIPDQDYIENCVSLLKSGIAENVGGLWLIQPGSKNWIGESIAAAAAHPFGVGDARYRYSNQAGFVDTVPYGAYFKKLFSKIGKFNEDLLANEDYELNVRIRNSGGRIFFDPKIRTRYVARSSIKKLAKQYWNYGFWKFKMLKKYPETIRWRQAIPPFFVLSIILFTLLGFFWPFAWLLLVGEIFMYLMVLVAGTFSIAMKKKKIWYLVGVPLAIGTMHFSWGFGFLSSIFLNR